MGDYHRFVRRRRLSRHLIEALLVFVAIITVLDFMAERASGAGDVVTTAQLQFYAMQHLETGQAAEAIAVLTVILENGGADCASHYAARGEAHMHLGQFTAAANDFAEAVRLEPDNAVWQRALYLARAQALLPATSS